MKDSVASVVAMIAVFVLAIAGVLFVPALRSAEDSTAKAVGPDLELARRWMSEYSETEEQLATVVNDLKALGSKEVALDDATVDALLERDREALAGIDDEIRDWQKLHPRPPRAGVDDREKPAAPLGANVAELRKAIIEGRKTRDALIAESATILDEAQKAIDKAMNSLGTSGGPTAVAAHRLKGLVSYSQGLANHRRAKLLARQADALWARLESLGADLRLAVADQDLSQRGAYEAKINQAQADAKKLSDEAADLKRQIATVKAEVADLDRKLIDNRAAAAEARQAMERLEETGIDLSAADGAERFAEQYRALAERYGKATAMAQAYEFGTLANARIDDTRDLVAGTYVPLDTSQPVKGQRGLTPAMADLRALEERLKAKLEQIEAIDADMAALASMKEKTASRVEEASKAAAGQAAEVRRLWQELVSANLEVQKAHDAALSKFTASKAALTLAGRAATEWVSEANSALQQVENPETRKRSAKNQIKDSREVAAFAQSQSADALYRAGLVQLDRMQLAERQAAMLESLRQVPMLAELGEEQLAAWKTMATEAAAAGAESLNSAFETWKSTGAVLGNHWTVAALAATALDALSRYGDRGLIELARANYEAAVSGATDPTLAEAYADRLKQIARTP